MWTALCSWNVWMNGISEPSSRKASVNDQMPWPGMPATYFTPYFLSAWATIWPPVNFVMLASP
jgi:hypothetical protein